MYRSSNIVKVIKSRRLRWQVRMEEGRSALKILTSKPTGKRLTGKPRDSWEGNIRMHMEEIGVNPRNYVIRLRMGIIESPCKCDIEPTVP